MKKRLAIEGAFTMRETRHAKHKRDGNDAPLRSLPRSIIQAIAYSVPNTCTKRRLKTIDLAVRHGIIAEDVNGAA